MAFAAPANASDYQLRPAADIVLGGSSGALGDWGFGAGVDVTRRTTNALEVGVRVNRLWFDRPAAYLCEQDLEGECAARVAEFWSTLALVRVLLPLGEPSSPLPYVTAAIGPCGAHQRTRIRQGDVEFDRDVTDKVSIGGGFDLGLEFSASSSVHGFLELGVFDVDTFHGFAPSLHLRTGAVLGGRD